MMKKWLLVSNNKNNNNINYKKNIMKIEICKMNGQKQVSKWNCLFSCLFALFVSSSLFELKNGQMESKLVVTVVNGGDGISLLVNPFKNGAIIWESIDNGINWKKNFFYWIRNKNSSNSC